MWKYFIFLSILFTALVGVFGVESNFSNKCFHQEKSEKQKYEQSPLVLTTRFVKFDLSSHYFESSKYKKPVQIAVFTVDRVQKGRFSFVETNGTINLLLYKGFDKQSRRRFCINESLLITNESYFLFLNNANDDDFSTTPTTVWNASYIPEKLPNIKIKKIIFGKFY